MKIGLILYQANGRTLVCLASAIVVFFLGIVLAAAARAEDNPPPNILLILADDLGFSDVRCYGSQIETPNLDRLAAGGLRFTQFYNAARCCPTRASLLTGLYPHQAGVGHMLQAWKSPAYTNGLNESCATIAELLAAAGYRTYHIGKWHAGAVDVAGKSRNHPMNRGFARAYGTGGGGNFFDPRPLYLDRAAAKVGADYYTTDAFTSYAVEFLREHGRRDKRQPFFMHLCYTAPHFPLQAKPADIAKYRDRFRHGWDQEREQRFARLREIGIIDAAAQLSPRDPVARAWADLSDKERDDWAQCMAVHAAMIDCMDQGIGKVLDAVQEIGAAENTLVLFLSDNGASAEALDSWPNPGRGHKPGSAIGSRESHRCLEVGWANAANTPFREHKMWVHEGGIATPLIAYWPAGVAAKGKLTSQVGHIIDLMPTLLEVAGASYPAEFQGRKLTPLAGESLAKVLRDESSNANNSQRTLAWEHEGNRAIRRGDWKLVAPFRGEWELYDLAKDRTETNNLAAGQPEKVRELAAAWEEWAKDVGVIPWEELPGAGYKPAKGYRKKSEPVQP
jgi:arylsulfatase A-like enzyme